jgi:hypothetical protein
MKSCLPFWIHHSIRTHEFEDKYEISFHINPFYQRGDFDGDGEPDYAVAIVNKKSKEKGIAIFHHPGDEVYFVAAGNLFAKRMDDFKWMGIWKVVRVDTLRSPWEDYEVVLQGEVLLCEKPESASGYVYWTGSGYDWFQGSD